jgi:AraC-like DNA-binding protein
MERGEDLSISKIAWLLGYQDVSGFSNAFKRWSGRDQSRWSGWIFSASPMARSRNIGTFYKKRFRLRRAPMEMACSQARRREAGRALPFGFVSLF